MKCIREGNTAGGETVKYPAGHTSGTNTSAQGKVPLLQRLSLTHTAPPLPRMYTAVAGGTRPEPASEAVRGRSMAMAPRPREVARVKGMQNHMRPPRM